MVVVIDVTVLHVAAPAISSDLDPTALQLLWIIDVYPLVAAPLLITSGVLGDRLGRRKLLIAGLVVFGVASLAATFAPTAATLILARALLGVGGAMIVPPTMCCARHVMQRVRSPYITPNGAYVRYAHHDSSSRRGLTRAVRTPYPARTRRAAVKTQVGVNEAKPPPTVVVLVRSHAMAPRPGTPRPARRRARSWPA